jgi:hypothetical protein
LPSSSTRCPPSGIDVSRQRFPQCVSILGAQVDLVLRTVQSEADGALCLVAVEVIDKESLYLLGHVHSISSYRLPQA